MDKYQKAILAIVIIIVVSSISYLALLIIGVVDTYFPFHIFLPGSIIIWIPIIARKKQEELKKRAQSRNCLKE